MSCSSWHKTSWAIGEVACLQGRMGVSYLDPLASTNGLEKVWSLKKKKKKSCLSLGHPAALLTVSSP